MIYILRHNWNVPYEASGTTIIPFEYDGEYKNLYNKLKESCDKSRKRGKFKFLNITFEESVSIYDVSIHTLNDWLSSYGVKN